MAKKTPPQAKKPAAAKKPSSKKSAQTAQPKKTRTRKKPAAVVEAPIVALAVVEPQPPPKAATIEAEKELFIQELRTNGGIVSDALIASGLARRTAYDHFKTDSDFAEDWMDALAISNDALFKEARRRAIEGEIRYAGGRGDGEPIAFTEKSDTLLIFLLKHGEAQKKWRNRVMQTARLAINTLQTEGIAAGIPAEHINQVQEKMLKAFEGVSLV